MTSLGSLEARLLKVAVKYGYLPRSRLEAMVRKGVDTQRSYELTQVQPNPVQAGLRSVGNHRASNFLSATPRKAAYKKLRSVTATESTTTASASGVVSAFGQWLIEAAKESLPVECKMNALRFQKTSDRKARIELVGHLYNNLKMSAWEGRHPLLAKADREQRGGDDGSHPTFEYSPWMVLPHVIGRFPDSPLRPNCIGASFLVAAWCELAEIPYMHCRLIVDAPHYDWQHYAQILRRSLGYCDANDIILPESCRSFYVSDIENYERMTAETASNSMTDAHAFVVAEITPGEWQAIDPWLERWFGVGGSRNDLFPLDEGLYSVDPSEAYVILQEQAQSMPGLTLLGVDRYWDHPWRRKGERLEEGFRIASALQPLVTGWREDPESRPGKLNVTAVALAQAIVDLELGDDFCDEAWNDILSGIFAADPGDKVRILAYQLLDSLFSRLEAIHGLDKASDKAVARFWDRFQRDFEQRPDVCDRVCQDWITLGIVEAIESSVNVLARATASTTKYAEPHPVIEYGLAPFQIGCGALLHLMAWDEFTQAELRPTDLLWLTSSQLVWHEAVTALHHRYQEADWNSFEIRVVPMLADRQQPLNSDFVEACTKAKPPRFAELLDPDRQDWEELLESAAVEWLSPDELRLVRQTTNLVGEVRPSQQHVLVRRLLTRLENERASCTPTE